MGVAFAVAAAAAGAAVLLLEDGRRRAIAVLVALLASALGLTVLVEETLGDDISARPALAASAAGAGLIVVVAIALLLRRRPALVAPLVVAALPFRVPLAVGEEAANLLVPLYAVIAGGALAYAMQWWRAEEAPEPPDRRLLWLRRALALVVVLYAVQALYSTDTDKAVKNICFFYVPFSVMFVLLANVQWSARRLRLAMRIGVGLAIVCAVIGFVEYATGHLLIPNPKVIAANELKSYFRVNSLFFDPNVYGRYVAIAMLPLAGALLWSRSRKVVAPVAALLALLWAGLVLSLSQSSFAALLVGLLVLAGLRWRLSAVGGMAGAVALAAVAVLIFTPSSIGVETGGGLNRATSGRVKLTEGAVDMVRDRPVWGFGSGSFSQQYRTRERVWAPQTAAESHTIPLTIAAEQGAIGLAGYVALVAVALALVLGGVRRALRDPGNGSPVARAVLGAAFCALLVHTLAYAAFLEDPLAWALLAMAAALRLRGSMEPAAA